MNWYGGGDWSGFAPYVSVAERKADAARTIARLEKKGMTLSPVHPNGRNIAKTFWGRSWCDNIESYRDYAYRLERGRKYLRSDAVIDLKIAPGEVKALVVGSERDPYQIEIKIAKMAKKKFDALVKRSAGKISSLMALAQGKLPPELLEDFCNSKTGLFPKPSEIDLHCSCPESATCCKHVAAVLYGIGARLDDEPTLFFTLRGIDPNAIVTEEVVDTLTAEAASEIVADDLESVFGIDIAETPAPMKAEPKTSTKTKKKKPTAKKKKPATKKKKPVKESK